MSDFDSNDDSGKVTLTDANEAKHGYAGEDEIAKRKWGVQTGETNENPVNEEPERPSEKPTTQLGAQIENQDELLSGVQTEDDQEFETADETVEMQGTNGQQFQADRDIRWTSPEAMDRGEYETRTDEAVAASMGLDELPVVDQSDREPIPELVDRRAGEGLAQYEERVGKEVLEAEESERARTIAERDEPPVEQGGQTECPVDDVKYAQGWFDGDEEVADEMSPSRRRAESAKAAAEVMSEQRRADFDERAKLEAGLEPDVEWSPIERIGEEIVELGPHVQKVAEAASITEKQALILLAEKRLETSSAGEAAMKAVGAAPQYYKVAPSPIEEVSPRGFVATVEGKVTHLFDPMNSNEHQVALIEDAVTGQSFKFIIHQRTRDSKAWTEFHGSEIVTDVSEGDVVKIIDGKPHYANGGVGANVKIHASSWTVLQIKEHGDGPYVSRTCPRERTIESSELDLPESLDEPAVKHQAGYHRNESTLDERRAQPANSAESKTQFERRETSDPTLVQWEYPAAWVPEKFAQFYDVDPSEATERERNPLAVDGPEVECPVEECEFSGPSIHLQAHMGLNVTDEAHAKADTDE